MQEAAVAYLEQVNVDNHDVYRRVTRAALWMESTCSFIKETQAEVEPYYLKMCHILKIFIVKLAGNIINSLFSF